MALTDEQSQELMDAIIEKCEAMELSPEEIIDGLGRALMSATMAFEKQSASITVEGVGYCDVVLGNRKFQSKYEAKTPSE